MLSALKKCISPRCINTTRRFYNIEYNPLNITPQTTKALIEKLKQQKDKITKIEPPILKKPDTTARLQDLHQEPTDLPPIEEVIPVVHSTEESTKLTVLPNGIKVASVENYNQNTIISAVFDAGCRYEHDPEERGLSVILNKLSFRGSKKYTPEMMAFAHDKIVFESMSELEMMIYNARFLRHQIDDALDVMSDSILHPRLADEDLEEVMQTLAISLEDQYSNPAASGVLTDLTMRACFGDESLGNPTLYLREEVTKEALEKYIQKYYRPERLAIVGVGVDHSHLVNLTQKYFKFDENIDRPPVVKRPAKWVGGYQYYEFLETPHEMMRQNIPALTAMTLNFEGFKCTDEDIYAIHVLETLLGGGDSFSAGGPGKGLHSKINNYYLSTFDFWSMSCQHQSFSDTGVFGIHTSATHENADSIVEASVHLATTMLHGVSEEDLQRAKNRFKFILLTNLEDLNSFAINIAADAMYFGRIRSGQELCERVDAVTMDDLYRVQKRILSSTPAIAIVGDVKRATRRISYNHIKKHFEKLKGKLE